MIMPLGWGVIREMLLEKGYTEKQIDEIKEIIHKVECEDF